MDSDVRQRRPNWTEEEKSILVEEAAKREERLFGKFKGAGKGTKAKETAWQEVTNVINARLNNTTKRTVDEVRKQHANIKQRAKAKQDALRRPKTGGGPRPPSPTPAEAAYLSASAGRPTLQGLLSGIDTEDYPEIPGITPQSICQVPLLQGDQEYDFASEVLTATSDSLDKASADIPSTSAVESIQLVVTDDGILQMATDPDRPSKKKRKASVCVEEILTLKMERTKFKIEIEKLKQETEYYKSMSELSKLKIQKLRMKIDQMKKQHEQN